MNCAIYIDADNVSYKSISHILSNANDDNIILKKIYADWTNINMVDHQWEEDYSLLITIDLQKNSMTKICVL